MAYDAKERNGAGWSSGVFSADLGISEEEQQERLMTTIVGSKNQDLVRHFHRIFGYDVNDEPTERTWKQMDRRYDLIAEEYDELRDELRRARPNITGIAQETADLVYVLYGLACEFGFDLDACVREVHSANMTKTPNPNGKALKGDGFVRADVEGVLNG